MKGGPEKPGTRMADHEYTTNHSSIIRLIAHPKMRGWRSELRQVNSDVLKTIRGPTHSDTLIPAGTSTSREAG